MPHDVARRRREDADSDRIRFVMPDLLALRFVPHGAWAIEGETARCAATLEARVDERFERGAAVLELAREGERWVWAGFQRAGE